jgi:glycosyltransferase involved in cell wall biosynthesis
MNYSVVIASISADKNIAALKALSQLPAKEKPKDVFVCVGQNPSFQRNLGVKHCKTPLVYFLDDDSLVIPGEIPNLISHFQDSRTAVVGGPNLVPPDAISFEKTVNSVLASWMGSFKVRSRYAAIGSVREATEKELILCNMMVNRGIFMAEGGFRVDLFPNEENEFLNRLLHKDYRLVYDPRAGVYRSRRKSLGAFCFQAFRYGRGRTQQMRVYPCLSDVIHLAPAFFLFYLVALLLPWVAGSTSPLLNSLKSLWAWIPLFIFSTLSIGTGISAASWHRRFMDVFKVPILIFLRHAFYGIGLVAGLFTTLRKPAKNVKVYKVQWTSKTYQLKFVSEDK